MRMNMTNNLSSDELEEMLKTGISGVQQVVATDLKGGDHWQVDIVADEFNGLNTMKKHRIVYKVLAEPLANETIHALIINAKGTQEV